jgi:hypothetical protein
MAERGVTCHRCGASTALPEDLRVRTFGCTFCGAEIETASVVGREAVSADALLDHIARNVASRGDLGEMARSAPRFEGGSAGTRAARCMRCDAPVEVPLDVTVHHFVCGGCGSNEPVVAYVSDKERLEIDMARQIAGNEAFKRLKAEGVPCVRCAGKNAVPDDGSVQLVCRFCNATILLTDHVDPSAIARSRLKHGAYAMRDQARAANEASQRRARMISIGIVVAIVVLIAVVNLVGILRH